MRKERNGGDLPFEASRPTPRNLRCAAGATAFGSQTVILDQITVAFDQSLATLRTVSVFRMADHAREIARINVAQARLQADFDRT